MNWQGSLSVTLDIVVLLTGALLAVPFALLLAAPFAGGF